MVKTVQSGGMMIRMLAFRVKLACAAVMIMAFCDIVCAQWSEQPENELLITGGWLFDGTGDEHRPNN